MVLYHYCPTETFFKILDSKELWFSDVTKSNDSSELEFSLNILHDYLLQDEPALYRKLYYLEFKKSLAHYRYYCCCLSAEGDKLSQWRAYAPNGGLSLGFDLKKLKRYSSSITVGREQCIPKRIYYSRDAFVAQVLKKIDFSKPYSGEFTHIHKNMPFYKDGAFREEREWRMGFWDSLREQFSPFAESDALEAKDKKPKMRYRKSEDGNSIVFYYAFPFPIDALTQIVIGPKCNLNEFDIMSLLDMSFPDCHIEPSDFSVINQSINKSRIPLQ